MLKHSAVNEVPAAATSSTKKRCRLSGPEDWRSDDVSRYLSSLGLHLGAKLCAQNAISGIDATGLRPEDIKTLGLTSPECSEEVAAALADISHPLMKTFTSCDSDGSFSIDAHELSQIMTRVRRGKVVLPSQVQHMVAEADTNDDGELHARSIDTANNTASKLHHGTAN